MLRQNGAASIGLKSRCKTMPTESDRRQFNLSAILSDGSDFCQGTAVISAKDKQTFFRRNPEDGRFTHFK